MKATDPGDAARIELLLAELRLPAVKQVWAALAAEADKEGWPAARLLAMLLDHETAACGRRRIERHLAEARLPPGKTLDTFDFEAVPVVSKARIMALAAGDAWLDKGANLCDPAWKIDPGRGVIGVQLWPPFCCDVQAGPLGMRAGGGGCWWWRRSAGSGGNTA
jgi:IstB-like ATP binding protein